MNYKSELSQPFKLYVLHGPGVQSVAEYAHERFAFHAYDNAVEMYAYATRIWLMFYAHEKHRGSLIADSNLGGRTLHVDCELSADDLPQECIDDCSAQGSVDDAVEHWCRELNFTVDRKRAIQCLQGYGAWDDLEEESDEALAQRVLWLACNDFKQYECGGESAGSDLFCLE